MTEEMISHKIHEAAQGRLIWLELKESYAFDDNTFVILFPQTGTACNAYVMKYLPDFIKKTNAGRVILLSYDEAVLSKRPDTDIEIRTRFVSREDALRLIDYYMLQMFTDRLVIASLDEPEGRSGRSITGIKGITEEEAVAVGVLGLAGI